ncbi:hypothetical protein JOQ06_022439 [Pogonophryne albipinna]|uniref:Ion transport domain-containing protein n=1 Tax=Pogonophryne albipinna TaxID=1090488 RepID=A0AAD6A992_9TELE|nr:hypothetical protein JOQ06_022439 [Pogonophryne albipinna]
MAVGMRALLDTVMQALPQELVLDSYLHTRLLQRWGSDGGFGFCFEAWWVDVGNLGLLFMLLFFIFAALGVELFGDLICDELHPCEGLGRYATFKNFGMAFLLLFRVSTGDNWNGIMKDTLRDCGQDSITTCYNTVVSPIYFVSFVLTAQFVLVNVVIAVLMKDSVNIRADSPSCLEPPLEGSAEMELSLMDNLSGSICHFYALPPQPREHSTDKKIPLAEMEALSLGSEKSWSLNLTDDSGPGDSNPFFISSQECNEEQLDPEQPLEANRLSVRKPAVVRTHSLPNDSYMFENTAPPDQIIAQNQGPEHTGGPHRNQSGSRGSVCSQPEDLSQLRVPADFFRPISPHSLSDSECIPRLPPPRRTHTLSRTLRRQVAVSTDSQEALFSDGGGSAEGLVNLALPLSPSTSLSPPLLPPRPAPFPPQEDLEVSLLTHRGTGSDITMAPNDGDVFVRTRQLKRFHSMDTTQGSNVAPPPRLPRPPRPYSWLDSPPETCFSSEGESTNPNRSPSSSSGFVFSQIHASPHRRKKKMSPPCISVDPPSDESGLYPPGVVVVGGGFGLPSPLPSRDTCLRRRAPSSDSFDLGVTGGEGGSVQLLTPPREEKL